MESSWLQVYTVKQGDTLYGIGRKVGFNWRYLSYLNSISNPHMI
jgi:LysM repeat protein